MVAPRLRAFLKGLLVLIAIIIAIVFISNQDSETRLFYSLSALVIYVAWLGQQQLNKIAKEKRYSCTFQKNIVAAESDDVLATLEIKHSLPFIPFPGLSVKDDNNPPTDETVDYDKHEYAEFFTGRIVSVCWRYNRFVCQVEPHKMAPANVLAAVIAIHYEYGWQLDGLHMVFSDIKKTMKSYIEEQEKKLADAKDDDEGAKKRRYELEKLRQKLKL